MGNSLMSQSFLASNCNLKMDFKKGKAIDLYSAFLCTPKAGGHATSNALSSLTGAAGHPGHRPQPAYTSLGSDPTIGQAAPVSSRSPPS